MQQILLASSSAYRKKIFEQLQLTFDTFSPDIDETPLPNEHAKAMVARLSLAKAQVAQERFPNAVCIGADSTAWHNNVIYGKPENAENAYKQLKAFSNSDVVFYTSISILSKSNALVYEKTHEITVRFRELSDERIRRYIQKDQPLYSCGSIKAEGLGLALVKSIQSDDPTALIGLPVIDLCEVLQNLGVEVV